jgi:hypothetical protein
MTYGDGTRLYIYLGPRNELELQFGQAYTMRYIHMVGVEVLVEFDCLSPKREPM